MKTIGLTFSKDKKADPKGDKPKDKKAETGEK